MAPKWFDHWTTWAGPSLLQLCRERTHLFSLLSTKLRKSDTSSMKRITLTVIDKALKTIVDTVTSPPALLLMSHFDRPRPLSHAPYGPLWANITSPTKQEVIQSLHCRQRRPSLGHNTYRKFREVWTCHFWDVQANRQTYRHIDYSFAHRNTLHPYWGRGN